MEMEIDSVSWKNSVPAFQPTATQVIVNRLLWIRLKAQYENVKRGLRTSEQNAGRSDYIFTMEWGVLCWQVC
jgi:hypothetical protein